MRREFCDRCRRACDGLPYFQTRHYQFERADVQGDIDYLMAEGAAETA